MLVEDEEADPGPAPDSVLNRCSGLGSGPNRYSGLGSDLDSVWNLNSVLIAGRVPGPVLTLADCLSSKGLRGAGGRSGRGGGVSVIADSGGRNLHDAVAVDHVAVEGSRTGGWCNRRLRGD